MTASEFPMFLYHREARCHRCGLSLLDLSPTKNAPGRGHYRGHCAACGVFTWYDCAEGSVDLINRNDYTERHPLDCLGHPAGTNDPMGQTLYCDGSCRGVRS